MILVLARKLVMTLRHSVKNWWHFVNCISRAKLWLSVCGSKRPHCRGCIGKYLSGWGLTAAESVGPTFSPAEIAYQIECRPIDKLQPPYAAEIASFKINLFKYRVRLFSVIISFTNYRMHTVNKETENCRAPSSNEYLHCAIA